MLKKRRFKKEKVVKVTFVLPPDVAARSVHLAGEFTGWEPSRALQRQKDGSWRTTIDLKPDREYQFRYIADGQRWLNDPDADKYVPNPHGEENSVVVT